MRRTIKPITNEMNTRTGRATTIKPAPVLTVARTPAAVELKPLNAKLIKAGPLYPPDDIAKPGAVRAWKRGISDRHAGKMAHESPYKVKGGVLDSAWLRGHRAVNR